MRTQQAVGARIRRLRTERGYTQESLARAVSVTLGQVSKWERGVDEPKIPALRRLCQALRVSMDELAG